MDYQEEQLATALDAPYGHWDDDKLRNRLQRLERLHLDMDNVCLPPFETSRFSLSSQQLWQDRPTQRTSDIAPKPPDGAEKATAESPKKTAESFGMEPPAVTGTERQSEERTVTLTVTGDDDQVSRVYFEAEEWKRRGMTVKIDGKAP